MKRKGLLFVLALGGIMLMQVSCSSYSYTSRSTDVRQRVINSSQATADLEINFQKKVTASSDWQKTPKQAMQHAIYQCIMNNNIDVVVDPIFQVETRSMTGSRATVTGFAGNYKLGVNAFQEVIDKNYKQEDIEKYLLLTDPNFAQYYYQGGSKGNVYNIMCGSAPAGKPAVAAAPALPKLSGKAGKKHSKLAGLFKKKKDR